MENLLQQEEKSCFCLPEENPSSLADDAALGTAEDTALFITRDSRHGGGYSGHCMWSRPIRKTNWIPINTIFIIRFKLKKGFKKDNFKLEKKT